MNSGFDWETLPHLIRWKSDWEWFFISTPGLGICMHTFLLTSHTHVPKDIYIHGLTNTLNNKKQKGKNSYARSYFLLIARLEGVQIAMICFVSSQMGSMLYRHYGSFWRNIWKITSIGYGMRNPHSSNATTTMMFSAWKFCRNENDSLSQKIFPDITPL